MALTRAALRNFYEDRAPYLEEIIGMGYKEYPEIKSKFLNTKSASTGWVDVATVSEFGLFQQKPELVDAKDDDIIEGPTARAQILTFAKQHRISEEAIEDKQADGIIENRVPALMKAANATREVLGHDILNSGFSSVTTPDGAALFSASHVNLSGVTWSNLLTTDLSQSELESAITMLKTQTNDRNIPIMQTPMKLIVSPSFEWAAKVILGTPNVVGNGNNDINPMSAQNLELVVSPYLTDSDAWFLLADTHGLNWYDRKPVHNWSDVDYTKKAMLVGAAFRCAVAATDARGVVGSTGA
jgi:hypothetical protein